MQETKLVKNVFFSIGRSFGDYWQQKTAYFLIPDVMTKFVNIIMTFVFCYLPEKEKKQPAKTINNKQTFNTKFTLKQWINTTVYKSEHTLYQKQLI